MIVKRSRHPRFPYWVELLEKYRFDKSFYEEVKKWAEKYNSDLIADCLFFPNEQTATMFLLKWSE